MRPQLTASCTEAMKVKPVCLMRDVSKQESKKVLAWSERCLEVGGLIAEVWEH